MSHEKNGYYLQLCIFLEFKDLFGKHFYTQYNLQLHVKKMSETKQQKEQLKEKVIEVPEEDKWEQVAMAIQSIHSALTEINNNKDYEISEHLEEIQDSLNWFDKNCY